MPALLVAVSLLPFASVLRSRAPRRAWAWVGAAAYSLVAMAGAVWGWLALHALDESMVASATSPDGRRTAYLFGPGLFGDYDLYDGERGAWILGRRDGLVPKDCPDPRALRIAWRTPSTPQIVRADGRPLERVDWSGVFDWAPR